MQTCVPYRQFLLDVSSDESDKVTAFSTVASLANDPTKVSKTLLPVEVFNL